MEKIDGEGIIVPKTISVDHAVWNAYIEKFGKGKVSELVRAVMKEEIIKAKKDEAQYDPLSLKTASLPSGPLIKQQRQLTLFEDYGVLSKYIHSLDDLEQLKKIEKTGKVVHDIARARKLKVISLGPLVNKIRSG